MSIDKFLQPRSGGQDTVSIDIVFHDRVLGEDVVFVGEFVKTTSKAFKQITLEIARDNAKSEAKTDDYADELLARMMKSAAINGEEIDRAQLKQFLSRYSQVGDYIDREASKDAVFIKPQSGGSSNTQKDGTNYKSQRQKAQKQQS